MLARFIDLKNKLACNDISSWLERYGISEITVYPEFLNCVVETYHIKGKYVICLEKDELLGIASFYHKQNLFGRNGLTSIPGGFWAKNKTAESVLMRALNHVGREHNLTGPFFSDLHNPLQTIPSKPKCFRAVKHLNGNEDDLLASYSKNIRRDIRNAEKYGLILEDSDDIEAFYSVWSHNMRDLGTPPIPRLFFINFVKNFKQKLKIFLVKKDSQTIGGALVYHTNDYAADIWLSSLRKYFKYGPNIFLYHEMFKWACRQGITTFDLGRSRPASGNEKFKLRFRSVLRPLFSYPTIPESKSGKKMNTLLSNAWKKLPVRVSTAMGSLIRRYIPFG